MKNNMKIKSITVHNFRSIKEASIDVSSFNIFIGQNNCGKTNFFEAIEFFYNGVSKKIDINTLKYQRNSENKIEVGITFIGCQEGLNKMQNEKNKAALSKAIGEIDEITIKRNSLDPKKRIVFANGEEVKSGTGFDTALNDFLPKFEYVNTKQYYESVAKYATSTPMGIMLSGVLSEIIQSNQQYRDFQNKFNELFSNDDSQIKIEFDKVGSSVKSYLAKQFPDCTKVKFEVSIPAFDDLLKNFNTNIDDGVETDAEEKGDGMQRALMLAIIQAYSDFRKQHEDTGKSFLFFIDEAELHLHPTAQRKLKDVLLALSKNQDQVYINTHSSVFIADNSLDQTIFKVEKNEGVTSIGKTEDSDKPNLVYELLGGSPADLLLPRNFLIVEGVSEFELLTRVVKRFYPDKPPIQIIKAQGDIDQAERTINNIERAFSPLEQSLYKERLVILTDKPHPDKEAGVKQFLDKNKHLRNNQQFFQLERRDIEQCYPNFTCPIYVNWRKTQEEVDQMDGKKKKNIAKHIGDKITKEQFEGNLKVCFDALSKCWELSF
jgi:predicted ATP-dependent endonuclease of OLD family